MVPEAPTEAEPAAARRPVHLEASWLRELGQEFEQAHMRGLSAFLREQRAAGKRIYPPAGKIFNALDSTPFEQVRVVILGQDPYHGPGQAHGLCFSVPPGIAIPPSLQNIHKELRADLGCDTPGHGNLQAWAERGVLLLNAVLTVEARRPASHQGRGWETFTDSIVSRLNAKREGLVFLLWGAYAQRKGAIIDQNRHLVLKAAHPSPMAADRGFFGCRHFSRANAYLDARGETALDWRLPP